MCSFTKRILTAIAFGVALCLPSIPAFSDPAPSPPNIAALDRSPITAW